MIRYRIDDVVKINNTLQDSNSLLRSISRGILINIASKKDINKIENEKNNFIDEFKVKFHSKYKTLFIYFNLKINLNNTVKKWGIQILDIDMLVKSIFKN